MTNTLSPRHARSCCSAILRTNISLFIVHNAIISTRRISGSRRPLGLGGFVCSLSIPIVINNTTGCATTLRLVHAKTTNILINFNNNTMSTGHGAVKIRTPVTATVTSITRTHHSCVSRSNKHCIRIVTSNNVNSSNDFIGTFTLNTSTIVLNSPLTHTSRTPNGNVR